jgi:hypothetical protein
MKVKVDRKNTDEGNLVFTITVSEPTYEKLSAEEDSIMTIVDQCQKKVDIIDSEDKLKYSVASLLNSAKMKAFDRVYNQIKSNIVTSVQDKFTPISQEIYNWVYDHQSNPHKQWMQELDPQRTKYYFDNDITAESNYIPQESEHEDEDAEAGWEED